MEIAGTYADVQVLLDRLRGRHVRPRADRYGAIILGVFFGGCALWLGIMTVREKGDASNATVGVVMMLALALSMLLLAFIIVGEAYAIYEVSPGGIEKHWPVRGKVWHVAPAEIHSTTLSFEYEWYLKIKTVDDRTRRVPLFGSLQNALATLYPEIGSSGQ